MSDTDARRLHLVILAGGSGQRAATDPDAPPKQFQEAGGRLIVLWSLSELASTPGVASIVLTCPDDWRVTLRETLAATSELLPPGVGIHIAPAGDTRTGSTWNALRLLDEIAAPEPDDLVAIHDAARPLATSGLLTRLADAAAEAGAAVPAVEVADTIVFDGEDGAEYLERARLRAVQTPQVFRWEIIGPAHRWAAEQGLSFTDDGSLCAEHGTPPRLVTGEAENRKLTTRGDMQRFRTGSESIS